MQMKKETLIVFIGCKSYGDIPKFCYLFAIAAAHSFDFVKRWCLLFAEIFYPR